VVRAIKLNGIAMVVAKSFARMFYRNAVNLGLPVIECKEIQEMVSEGDRISINLTTHEIRNLNTNYIITFNPIPGHLMKILEKGGLMETLENSK
jgi:3-isopropylmalate/(R)-2-methylmalate dehydratase small subunit